MKTCTFCKKELPLCSFGKHKHGKDGIRARCKSCEVLINGSYRKTQKGKQKLYEYRSQDRVKDSIRKSNAKWINSDGAREKKRILEKKFADRVYARNKLNNAVSFGKVIPLPCFCCGEKAEAHHPDYSHPLDVIWLCPAHHKQAHAMARKAA